MKRFSTSPWRCTERPYRPADLFSAQTENPDELFVAAEEPLGVVEVTVERDVASPLMPARLGRPNEVELTETSAVYAITCVGRATSTPCDYDPAPR